MTGGPPTRRAKLVSTRRVTVVTLALMLILAAIPATVKRDANRQALFAWEMYSKGAPRDEFLVVGADGGERLLTVADVQPRGVAPVDYAPLLPSFICRKMPMTERVVVLRADQVIETFSCSG